MADNKLTTSSDEAPISDIFSGDVVFGIPYFQRPYKWKKNNIEQLENDLLALIDIEDSSHFLGAVILYAKQNSPSDPKYYEVIDGQQRLTTCYLSLLALTKVLVNHNDEDNAIGLYQKYIAIGRNTHNITNAKLISCKEDRAAMNSVFDDVMTSSASFASAIGSSAYKYKKMPDTGSKSGNLWKNYNLLISFFESQYENSEKQRAGSGIKAINKLYSKLVSNMSFVQIVVKNPTDGPKIFDSLNSKQEPMTTGDLVRNEVFSNFSSDNDEEISNFDEVYWHPFYERFNQAKDPVKGDKAFEQYFFPYVLTIKNNVKNSEAFSFLRSQWEDKSSPAEIIDDLKKHQDAYLDLYYGTSLLKIDNDDFKARINRLSRMNTPTSVYPFLLEVIYSVKNNTISANIAIGIFERIESFLVRRSTCGYEPTGLHAVFKSLWEDANGNYSPDNIEKIIRSHPTVSWPDNNEFKKNILNRNLYKVRMTTYILEEWNADLGGDIPNLESSKQIEHVLPERPGADSKWLKDWKKTERDQKTNCLANLLPLSKPINASIQNADYSEKKKRYLDDSALKSPREFAKNYKEWTPKEFNQRAQKMTTWALKRWPY